MNTQHQSRLLEPHDTEAPVPAASGAGTVKRQAYYVTEVAVLLGIGRTTAYELVRRGTIRSVRVGRRILVTRAEIDRLLGRAGASQA